MAAAANRTATAAVVTRAVTEFGIVIRYILYINIRFLFFLKIFKFLVEVLFDQFSKIFSSLKIDAENPC